MVNSSNIFFEAWRRGILDYKLRPEQRRVKDFINGDFDLKRVLKISRRLGKTHTTFLDAVEFAIKNPFSQIAYIAPELGQIRKVLAPIYRKIFIDCPEHLQPIYNQLDNMYIFPNGSKIIIGAADKGRLENLRGMDFHRVYIDEAGFIRELKYLLNDIVQPQTMTTSGKVIISSTPPKTPSHYFTAQLVKEAEAKGNLLVLTLDDHSGISQETKNKYIEESGGYESTAVRREYYCEDVTEDDRKIISEYNEQASKEILSSFERPEYFDLSAGMDYGFKPDYNAYVLGYYDFKKATYCIEGEFLQGEITTKEIADKIMCVEKDLFDGKEVRRFSDTDKQIIHDLHVEYGVTVYPTKKDNKEAQINNLRTIIKERRLKIHTRCANLDRQLKNGIWNKSFTEYERVDGEGHFDLIDALLYFIRNVDTKKNPYPSAVELANMKNKFILPRVTIAERNSTESAQWNKLIKARKR